MLALRARSFLFKEKLVTNRSYDSKKAFASFEQFHVEGLIKIFLLLYCGGKKKKTFLIKFFKLKSTFLVSTELEDLTISIELRGFKLLKDETASKV